MSRATSLLSSPTSPRSPSPAYAAPSLTAPASTRPSVTPTRSAAAGAASASVRTRSGERSPARVQPGTSALGSNANGPSGSAASWAAYPACCSSSACSIWSRDAAPISTRISPCGRRVSAMRTRLRESVSMSMTPALRSMCPSGRNPTNTWAPTGAPSWNHRRDVPPPCAISRTPLARRSRASSSTAASGVRARSPGASSRLMRVDMLHARVKHREPTTARRTGRCPPRPPG